ncbi:MAG: efflux RND transporter periplasmic adaptor subunit [Pseudomonadales bacterium]
MIRKFIVPAAILIASVFGAVTLLATSPELKPSIPEPVAATVRVLEVQPRSVQLTVHSQGTVAPNTESELIPEVSGRVRWISPSLVNGGSFESGEALLRLEDQDYRSAVERARAALSRAEAEFEHAQFEFQRMESLEAKQLASRSVLENALRAYRVAEATLQDTRASIEQAGRDLSRTEIRAPFTGLVRRESVDIGQFVSRGAAVATLYATADAEVRLPIADRQLAFLNMPVGIRGELPVELQPGVTLSAEFAGQQLTWRGRIVRTEAAIDTMSRMVNVVARVDNDADTPPLAVGLFVNAEIEGLIADNVIVLPRSALREGNRVLVVDAEDRLRYRQIEPLRLYQDEVLVAHGLAAGERVCISPIQTAVEGMPVKPVTQVPDAAIVSVRVNG